MDIQEAINGRRAVRNFTGEALDEATIRPLLDAAIQAPSAMNQQPWGFAVVRDHSLLDRISRDAKSHMLATMGEHDHSDHFRSLLDNPQFQIFYDAPVLIVICATARGPWMVEDCSLAAENLMLAAHASGLGTCWIGFAQSLLESPEGKAMLHLPSDWAAVAPIVVGHPKSLPPAVPRKPPDIRWVG